MKLLREYIRELLTEGAKGPQDLIDIPNAFIRVVDKGDEIEIYYGRRSTHGSPHPLRGIEGRLSSGELESGVTPWGDISIGREDMHGPCGDAFMVGGSAADHGWGPLLYDVAMEYATMKGGGMMADRTSVSGAARDVWAYYLGNRGGVTAHQLDNLRNTLTPDIEEDNCDQTVSLHNVHFKDLDAAGDSLKWAESPLSKRYTKPPTTIDALRAAGRLIER